MELIKAFINEYGTTILYAVLTFIFGWLGVKAKQLAEKWLDTKTKKEVARTVVMATEQIYKDLRGEEKLNEALKAASEMLASKGITVTELELRMLVESAVGEFNKAFDGKTEPEAAKNDEEPQITFIAHENYDENGDPIPNV